MEEVVLFALGDLRASYEIETLKRHLNKNIRRVAKRLITEESLQPIDRLEWFQLVNPVDLKCSDNDLDGAVTRLRSLGFDVGFRLDSPQYVHYDSKKHIEILSPTPFIDQGANHQDGTSFYKRLYTANQPGLIISDNFSYNPLKGVQQVISEFQLPIELYDALISTYQ